MACHPMPAAQDSASLSRNSMDEATPRGCVVAAYLHRSTPTPPTKDNTGSEGSSTALCPRGVLLVNPPKRGVDWLKMADIQSRQVTGSNARALSLVRLGFVSLTGSLVA